ncbi:nucleoside hydrolase [Bacilli bacterium]|uniref:nucleoside hydrolase n=1 Tax=Oceanobacillus TaxID=182709 RepID=UPI0006228052|nr:nucleoside hydrolase [Bacilli bacterium VT-13-104]PZD89667.1 nucleoside hydrolase [Bacilli bacterium]PZD91189.1 nucleoside hydrolase [Bacilli bacterium]PZD92736.1 nucleoside hydrolase [Bacilli bacterium]RCO07422.1 nucleoside hydrolase [Bacilli bacterium]
MAKKVLLFGDIGIDDTVALIYAYLSKNIDVVGVVADYGNIPRENAIANINYVHNIFDTPKIENVKIIAGAELSMTGEIPKFYPEIHGEYGLGPIIPPADGAEVLSENFYEVIEIINEHFDDLIIVNIGRLTSLATLFILQPNLMKQIKEYYIMGGAFWYPGNVTSVSEANFHGDPIAAQLVLSYANRVKIYPLNVTSRAIVTPEMVNYIDQVGKVPLIKTLLDYYYNFYKKRDPSVQGSPLHDVLTIMAVYYDDMLKYESFPVYVVRSLNGTERGQSIADIRPFGSLEEETTAVIKKHQIASQLDYPKFFNHFMEVMTGGKFE